MPEGSLFLYLKSANGVNDFCKTAVTGSDELLSINNCDAESRLLCSFTVAINTLVESGGTCALQNATAIKNINRVTNRFNIWMFYQTYINSVISHISYPFFCSVFEAGGFLYLCCNG